DGPSVAVLPGVSVYRPLSGLQAPVARAYDKTGRLVLEVQLNENGQTEMHVLPGQTHKVTDQHGYRDDNGQPAQVTVTIEYKEGHYALDGLKVTGRDKADQEVVITPAFTGGKSLKDFLGDCIAQGKLDDPQYALAKSIAAAYDPQLHAAVDQLELTALLG